MTRDEAKRAILKAVAAAYPDAEAYAEPFSGEKFSLTVLWNGFELEDDDARQERVRAAARRALGDEAAEALAYVAFIFAWTRKEKKHYDIDKL